MAGKPVEAGSARPPCGNETFVSTLRSPCTWNLVTDALCRKSVDCPALFTEIYSDLLSMLGVHGNRKEPGVWRKRYRSRGLSSRGKGSSEPYCLVLSLIILVSLT